MSLVYLYITGVIGSVFWLLSTEAHAAAYGTQGYHPLLVATICTVGQHTTYLALYFFGEVLTRKSVTLQRAIGKVYDRFGSKLDRYFLALTGAGALLGVPPAVGMVMLSPSFGLSLKTVFAVTIPLRFVRFAVLAWAGESLWSTIARW